MQCSRGTGGSPPKEHTSRSPRPLILNLNTERCALNKWLFLQDVERITGPDQDYHASIQFTYWIQFQLHVQLLDASKFAARHRVALKGDLPIGAPLATPHSPSLARCALSLDGGSVGEHGERAVRQFLLLRAACCAMTRFCAWIRAAFRSVI